MVSEFGSRSSILPWVALATIGPVVFSACTKKETVRAAPPPLTVRVVQVEERPLELGLEVTGSLVSSVAVEVKNEFAGRLVNMLKNDGDPVTKGELLAQLDDADARLALAQARAALEVAEAAVVRAQVAEEHATNEHERAKNLLKSGGITDRDLQAAQVTEKDARAQVKLASAQVEQARQAVAQAEKRLRDCRIHSPITGEVEMRFVNPGGWLDGSQLLYRLVDNRRLELKTFVASSDLAQINLGQTIRFGVAAYPGEQFEAKITHISAAVDAMNRSAPVLAAVPNPGGKLKAGMFAKGRIITGVKPKAIVLAADAVWRRSGQAPFVFVVENQQARKREVQLGHEDSGGIEISQGLRGGEMVILEQNLELADGVAVAPRS
jgi:membrane fusion protein (multidrug efflux system)